MARRYDGHFDAIDGKMATGWAICLDQTDRNGLIDIFVDNAFHARLCADQFRSDLKDGDWRGGFAGFNFEIPSAYCDGRPHVIDIRHAGTNKSLGSSPKTFEIHTDSQATLDEKRRWCDQNVVFENKLDKRFVQSLETTRKLVIFSTYHELTSYLEYHRMTLRSLSAAGFTIVVVHAANTYRHELGKIDIPNCFAVLKRNVGYDFGSYAVGVFAACDSFHLVDELILMNDSMVQITDDILPMIQRYRGLGVDVASCTDSFEREYHLQSYMLWFGEKICHSTFLQRFMSKYTFTSNKEDVIAQGELGLSRALFAEGYSARALYDYESIAAAWLRGYDATVQLINDLPGLPYDAAGHPFKRSLMDQMDLVVNHVLSGKPMNSSHFFWDTLVEEFGCPFIKRELILSNPCNVPTYFKLASHLLAQSEVEAALIELRRRYGGHLIPTSIALSPSATRRKKRVGVTESAPEPVEPALKLLLRPELNGFAAHMAPGIAPDQKPAAKLQALKTQARSSVG
jgi:hypothetical protein